jgi:hypothetical protein
MLLHREIVGNVNGHALAGVLGGRALTVKIRGTTRPSCLHWFAVAQKADIDASDKHVE